MLLAQLVIITIKIMPYEVETLVINRVMLLNSSYFLINLLIAVGFLFKGQPTLIANPIATSLFYLGVILLERFSTFKLTYYIRGLVLLTLVGHSLLGEYYRAYYTTTYFDNILHFVGAFTFALFAFELLNTFIKIRSSHPALLTFMLITLLGICLGTFFELLEFLLDQLLHERNQFGLFDTNMDLVFDALGACFAGIFIVYSDSFIH